MHGQQNIKKQCIIFCVVDAVLRAVSCILIHVRDPRFELKWNVIKIENYDICCTRDKICSGKYVSLVLKLSPCSKCKLFLFR